MDFNIKENLINEYNEVIEKKEGLPVDSAEYKTLSDLELKIMDRIMSYEETEIKFAQQVVQQEVDNDYKEQQIKIDKKDRTRKHVVELVKCGVGVIAAGVAYWASSKFERDGHVLTEEGGKSALKQLLKFRQ